MVNDLNIEELLFESNPVLDPEELRLSAAEVEGRCTSILEGRGAMQTETSAREDLGVPQTRRWRRPVLAFMTSFLAILIAAGGLALVIGGGDPDVAGKPTATTQTAPTATTATTSPTSTSAPATVTGTVTTTPTSTYAPATSTTTATSRVTAGSQLVPPTSFVPPEIYPPEGLSLDVVGVAHDGALNVRQEPGLTRIVATLGPFDRVNATGAGRELGTTTWWQVTVGDDTLVDGTIGWVNASYLASSVSARVSLTSFVEGEYGGQPAAATMAELGQIVAETLVSEDYPSRFAMLVATTASDPVGFSTFDVVSEDPLGLRIALRGASGQNIWRFKVTATRDDGSFHLDSVEGQAFMHACACWLP